MKFGTLLLSLIALSGGAYSQFHKKKNRPLVELDGTYKMSHFYISPGLSFMLPNEIERLGGIKNDSINPRGRLAYLLEFGGYKIFNGGGNIFNYMDYGISYKKLSGSEVVKSSDNKTVFKKRYLSFNYNINNIYQINDTRFLQTSLGANLDLMLFEKQPAPTPFNTDRLLMSFHLKLGYGMKFQNRLFIIPTLESPILNLKQWESGKSTYGIMNSRYRPLLLKVRILWLKRPDRSDCPPVYLNPEDKSRYDRNYMQ